MDLKRNNVKRPVGDSQAVFCERDDVDIDSCGVAMGVLQGIDYPTTAYGGPPPLTRGGEGLCESENGGSKPPPYETNRPV